MINDIINDEKSSPTLNVSKQLCKIQSRSRDIVTNNGPREEAFWYSGRRIVLSNQEPVTMITNLNAQHNFQPGLLRRAGTGGSPGCRSHRRLEPWV